jgi:hypothetical protein
MTSQLFTLLSSLEQLPAEDVNALSEAVAGHFLGGVKDGGFETGLLTGDPVQLEEMKAALITTIQKDFIGKVGRIITENPEVNAAVAKLFNPYALGVIRSSDSRGFQSDLVVASDPQNANFFTASAWKQNGYRDVQPYLARLPEGRDLRTPGQQLWVGDQITRSMSYGASGATEYSYIPPHTDSFAMAMDSGTRETEELNARQVLSFVPTILVPLVTVRAFRPESTPAPSAPRRSGLGAR